MKTQAAVVTCIAALTVPGAVPVFAQGYPVKPVRIIVAQAPGAQSDLFTRLIGQKFQESLGQPFVSDPRPGAGGAVGAELAARAAPDGYTLLMATNSTHSANPALYSKLPYDAVRDFAPIALTIATPYLLTVHPSLPVTTLKQLIAFAKSRPGQLNYGSAGNGSTHHLCGELLKSMAGIDLVHVPYKGGPPSTAATLGGEVAMHFSTVAALNVHIKAGRLKALGLTTSKRSSLLPDVPTLSEAGLPGFEMLSWFGLLGPAATPRAIVTRLNAETVKALSLPDMKSAIAGFGSEIMVGSPEQFADYIKSEIARIGKIARDAGIRAE
jgi:tripartite-type tricarboxylate transporter receptor subunit TctC